MLPVSDRPSSQAGVARTAIASTHVARLVRGAEPPEVVPYVDDGGEPLLLLARSPGALAATPGARAVLAVSGPEGALAVLVGRLHRVGPLDEAAKAALRRHARCLTSSLSQPSVVVCRLAVHEVVVVLHGQSHAVNELAYAAAEPDTFAVHGRDLADHLTRDHADLLRGAASARVEGTVIAVGVRAVCADRIDLDVVTSEGASTVAVPLSPPVGATHDVCDRLLELTLGLA
jgi:hypothetical protein